MTSIIDTGSDVVDALGEMNFEGNIIPDNWYKTVIKENGKAYLLAICILSEIVYWYRPTYDKDEFTGDAIYTKKFRGDILQKSYSELADLLGESKRAVKAAMDRLEELGIILREFRDLEFSTGGVATNVMYVHLNVQRLREVTYFNLDGTPVKKKKGRCETSGQNVQKSNPQQGENLEKKPASPVNTHVTKNCRIIPQKNVGYPTENCDIILQENEGYPTENCDISPQKVRGYPTKKCETNTKTTTETTAEITTEITSENAIPIKSNPIQSKKKNDRSSSDGMDMDKTICNLREEIRNRVQYDALSTDNRFDKEILDEIIEIMIEVYVMRADVKVSGKVIPYQLVRHRLDCYDQMLMEYVLFSLQDNPSKVGNIKQYLLATIINAPATESNYYRNQVNHDFL